MTVPDRFRYNRDLGQFELTYVGQSVRQLNTIKSSLGTHFCPLQRAARDPEVPDRHAFNVHCHWAIRSIANIVLKPEIGCDMYGN